MTHYYELYNPLLWIIRPITVGSRIRAYQNIKPQEKESVLNSLPQEIEENKTASFE